MGSSAVGARLLAMRPSGGGSASRHASANSLGHNYVGHNCVGHNYKGHKYVGHSYVGRIYLGHNYVGHNYVGQLSVMTMWAKLVFRRRDYRPLCHAAWYAARSVAWHAAKSARTFWA